MLETSSAGRGPARVRSINVEANLLRERVLLRSEMQQAANRRVGMIWGLAALVAFGMPPLFQWQQAAHRRAQEAQISLARSSVELTELRERQQRTAPALQSRELQRTVELRSDRYLSALYQFFGATRPNMVLNSLRLELIAGEMKLTARANAESYEAYQEFVARLQRLGGEQNVLPRSIRSSPELGEDAVVFELIQKATVRTP